MNKQDKDKMIIIEADPSINDENVDTYIEELIKEWDGSAYGSMKWDHEKQKWVRVKFQ
jgi:hypothetical protein